MEPTIFDKIHDVELKETMEKCYVDYAMSVISSRALPDVRDGLKPVQRRVLFSMLELSNTPDKPHRKCARIVGDTMGKYHPHGDSSIYGALVYMAQPWNEHYPLVDGHGNFGSVDGDGAAAMRYTEARLSKISMEMLQDLNKKTVDFVPNFEETEMEPTVLPARVPNLLINGAQGIAVGMATNIPPHNLKEVVDAVCKVIENKIEDRDTSIDEVMSIIQGPDFPTGALILGRNGINQAYRTGRGKLKIRSVYTIEPMENGKNRIVVTEIPYLVNKARLIEKIADLHKEKRVDGITDIRDESTSREGTRIVIELRRDVNANVIMNQLLKHTDLECTYGVIMLALVDGVPKVLTLLDMLKYYLKHQEEVVTRRTKFDLENAEKRAHILEGLLIALDNIDEVIRIIRGAANVTDAKLQLEDRFGLSDAQAQAIVDMRLRALTGLERSKLEEEYAELVKTIAYLKSILGDEKILLGVIKEELSAIGEKYQDDRKTHIERDENEIEDEDLIQEGGAVIAMTKKGYIKRMSPDNFRQQNRGGRGIKGMQVIDDDYTIDLEITGTKSNVLFFTNQGRVYLLKAYEIPEAARTSRGTPVINLIPLQAGETVKTIITGDGVDGDRFILMATRKGIIKKTPASEYANIRKNGLLAIMLREDDELVTVKDTAGDEEVLMVTKGGMTIRFNERTVRTCGRVSIGVKGIDLQSGDEVVGMEVAREDTSVLFVSEFGMGKRTRIDEFKTQGRGGKGLIGYRITEKTGQINGTATVSGSEELMIMTTEGIVIRTNVSDIPILGRSTSGVKLMSLARVNDERIASFTTFEVPEELKEDSTDPDEKSQEEEDPEKSETDTELSEENSSDEE